MSSGTKPGEKKEEPLKRPRFTKLSDIEHNSDYLTYINNPLPYSKRTFQTEQDTRALQKQKIEILEDFYQYQLDILITVCTEIAKGKIWWIPHFMEQMGCGIIDIKAAIENKDDYLRGNMRDYIIEYARRELSSGFQYGNVIKYMIDWLEDFSKFGSWQSMAKNPFFVGNYHLNEDYICRTGICFLVKFPPNKCQDVMKNKHYLPADGLFYSFYLIMNMLAGSEKDFVFERYWREKLAISYGTLTCFDTHNYASRPDLLEDLKQTRRWSLFDLYELEMTRRAATRLLLCAREREPGCPFHKDAFPRDLLKVIFVLADLLPTDEEREKVRRRVYYVPVEK